jgi:2-polyprenyl-6-methoxyphenol hydroxylase-like FAD-dependent oxidoreductase
MKKEELRITIVGAGIGGLMAAIALIQKGFNVQIYEKADELKDPHIFVTLFPNAMMILNNFGMAEEVYSKGNAVELFTLSTHTGKLIREYNLSKEEFKPVSILREHFYSIILKKLPEGIINFGYALRDYEIYDDQISIVFTNDCQIKSDLLVGADGIYSRVRSLMLKEDDPIYQGYQVWRGIIDAPFADILDMGTMQFWGRGKRFGFTAIDDKKIAWWAASKESIHRINHMQSDRKKKIYKYFRSWAYPVPELIKATNENLISKVGVFAKTPPKNLTEEFVTLLGEAAHSLTPNFGLGVSLAIEDAVILARCLDKYHSVPDALLYYEDARIERVKIITEEVIEFIRIGHFRKPLSVGWRNIILKYTPKRSLDKKIRNIFDFNALKSKI